MDICNKTVTNTPEIKLTAHWNILVHMECTPKRVTQRSDTIQNPKLSLSQFEIFYSKIEHLRHGLCRDQTNLDAQ